MRRNLLLAQILTEGPLEASVLLIAGACQINKFTLPQNVDCLTLPSLCKNSGGEYQVRHLDVSLHELLDLRSGAIRATLEAFAPDLLLVDNVPRGAVGELDRTHEFLCNSGRTRRVLGLRDVLDTPEAVRREWANAENHDVIRDCYDAVWIYGDPAVYDATVEYDFPADVAEKVRFTGYLDGLARLQNTSRDLAWIPPSSEKLALCLVGGGQDGDDLAAAFARMELPQGYHGVIVTGPFMPVEARRRLQEEAERRERLSVFEFVSEPTQLLKQADRVIAMGGYNTVCEVLSSGKPALIVPRVTPRTEQLVRAKRLRDLGLIDVLTEDELSPMALSEWLAREVMTRPEIAVDINGLSRIPGFVIDALATTTVQTFTQEEPLPRKVRHAAIQY